MRLLVSVSNIADASAALAGGAAIVDCKDPARGALEPVGAEALRAIRAAVPPEVPLSAALGEVTTAGELALRLTTHGVPLSYVKVAFRGLAEPRALGALLDRACAIAEGLPGAPGVIAVAYADCERVGSLPARMFPAVVGPSGARGLLVDTAVKDGTTLFDWLPVAELARLGEAARRAVPEFALAGSLRAEQLALTRSAGATIVGVRGAACEGGRAGPVSADRVAQLVRSLAGSVSTSSAPSTDQRMAAAARGK